MSNLETDKTTARARIHPKEIQRVISRTEKSWTMLWQSLEDDHFSLEGGGAVTHFRTNNSLQTDLKRKQAQPTVSVVL